MARDDDDKVEVVSKQATNYSDSARGVNTVNADGSFAKTIILQPGETQVISTTEAEMAGATDIVYEEPGTETEADKKDKAKKAKVAGKVASKVDKGRDVNVDLLSDDELHDFLEKADGRRRPANTSRDTLLDQARESQGK